MAIIVHLIVLISSKPHYCRVGSEATNCVAFRLCVCTYVCMYICMYVSKLCYRNAIIASIFPVGVVLLHACAVEPENRVASRGGSN